MGAGIPISVPSHTVTQACISSVQAITTGSLLPTEILSCRFLTFIYIHPVGAEKILSGQADVVLTGGCETFSDVPIRFSKPIRERLLVAPKAMKKVR